MFQDLLVGLSLSVLEAVEVSWIRPSLVARLQVCKVALNIAGCTTTSRSSESDVGRHLDAYAEWAMF